MESYPGWKLIKLNDIGINYLFTKNLNKRAKKSPKDWQPKFKSQVNEI